MQKEIEKLRRKFREGRSELFRQVKWTSPSRDLLEAHTVLVDSLVKEIYDISTHDADLKAARNGHSGLAIVATGGYGRRELNPYSDVDIAFIPSEEEDPWVEAAVHTAFKLVMDVFLSLKDVQVGYSFRPVAEVSSWDVHTKTALLDLRPICGDPRLAEKLKRNIRDVLPVLDLMLESLPVIDPERKRENTIYSVEPSLKDGFGALRDLHCGRWIFKLFYGIEDEDLESALRQRAGMSDRQIAEIREAADWFWRARNWLHLAAGRRSDVLINNYQDKIARELGNCSAQTWLSRHLRHAEVFAEFRKAAVNTVLRGPLDIRGVRLENGCLHLPDQYSSADSTVFALHTSQRHSIPLCLKDVMELGANREQAAKVAELSGDESRLFRRILDGKRNVASTLRSMAESGLLDRFIPHFMDVMRFVPPDPAHTYTVGEHSLRMVEHLERLRAGLDMQGQRFMELLNQCAHFDMLCLAALLHDAGKLLPGNDHCESSAELAKAVSRKLNLAAEKKEILDIVIRQHLLLVRTARLHDLTFANVIQPVAERVPNLEALRHLYVFTYVDTFAVSDSNWTSMDVRDMEDLYRKMQDFYTRTSDAPAPEEKIGLIRKRLVALQPSENEKVILKHYDTMPAGYLLNTPLETIANHIQLLDRMEMEQVVLDVYNRPGDDYSELTLCTPDDPLPGILAKITGVLYGCGIDIQKAQAFTMEKKKPVVLDTLWIRSNGMQISEYKARKIQTALRNVLSGKQTLDEFLKQSKKNPPEGIVLESIDLRNDLSEEHTVVHIISNDQQGLLFIMSRSLSRCGLDIHSAKVTTWHGHAENNFYVTTDAGRQIPNSDLSLWVDHLQDMLQGAPELSS